MALSDDLRKRVVEAVVEGGLSRNAAAKRFDVSIASAVRWVIRHRTTPWIAGVGPSSTMRASVVRCSSLSREGCPGALRSTSPSGAMGVETQNPVADDLEPDPTDLRRLA
jgi:transposase-like protein